MKNLTRFIFTAFLAATTALVWAQPSSSSVFEDVTDTPVNSGLIALLALGVGYGIYKLYKKNKSHAS